MARIYLSPPHMGGEEETFVKEAFDSNWLSTVGPNLVAFEEEMGAYLGGHCVALSSGTAAIHLALRLVGVRPDDDVFCPSLTFVASCNPVLYLGANPVFVDSERASWNVDPLLLDQALRERQRQGRRAGAVVVVHLYGQTADMDAIDAVCREHGVPVVEDAAEALGASHGDRKAGRLAPVAALSFNGNKIITTTGGGMLVCEREEDAAKARYWSTQARDPGVSYEHSEVGYNYRMSNVLAGIGRGQLRVLDERVATRRATMQRYVAAFADLPGIEPMPEASWGSHTRWLSCFTVDPSESRCTRDQLIDALTSVDAEARPAWKPMHMQALFSDAPMFGGSVAKELFHRGICLPSGSALTDEEQARVIDAIRSRAGA